MEPVLILTLDDLLESGCFSPCDAIKVTRKALQDFSLGKVLYPEKVCQIFDEFTQSRINGLPATLLDDKVCGIKWVSVFPQNPQKYGTQNLSAVIMLSEIEKGYPIAYMEGTLCSNLRTAAVGALAASYLSKKVCNSIGFIGAGEQAKMHFITMKTVHPEIKVCKVASRTHKSELSFISSLSKLFDDVEFVDCNSEYRVAAEDSDIIVSAISGQSDLLKARWIKKGAFYCHVGGWEDEYAVPLKAEKIVCDNWEMVKHRSQTVSRMYQEGIIKDTDIYADLHEIVSQNKNGRENDDEFVYFNSVGLSYVDVALAYYMYKKALSCNVGQKICLQEKMIFDYDLSYNFKKKSFEKNI